jgi:hypothetical protein
LYNTTIYEGLCQQYCLNSCNEKYCRTGFSAKAIASQSLDFASAAVRLVKLTNLIYAIFTMLKARK